MPPPVIGVPPLFVCVGDHQHLGALHILRAPIPVPCNAIHRLTCTMTRHEPCTAAEHRWEAAALSEVDGIGIELSEQQSCSSAPWPGRPGGEGGLVRGISAALAKIRKHDPERQLLGWRPPEVLKVGELQMGCFVRRAHSINRVACGLIIIHEQMKLSGVGAPRSRYKRGIRVLPH